MPVGRRSSTACLCVRNGWSAITTSLEPLAEYLKNMGASMPVSAEVLHTQRGLLQQGDSCMKQYNTFEALKYYQQAFEQANTYEGRQKLADCYYKRGNYRQTAELLKLVPEDSLSHEAFRQLANSYQKQGDSTFNTLYSAGMCYSQLEDLELAYKYLQLAFLVSGMQHKNCAYRLGVVCIDTKRYPEGLRCLELAKQMMLPDTTIMKAITLSLGEGYYLTQHFEEAVTAWKEHLTYNPTSVATYYNIGNAYNYILKDPEQAKTYYQQFIEKAASSSTV